MLVWIGVFTSNGREHVVFDTKAQCGDKLMGKQEITSIQNLLVVHIIEYFLLLLLEKPWLICHVHIIEYFQ